MTEEVYRDTIPYRETTDLFDRAQARVAMWADRYEHDASRTERDRAAEAIKVWSDVAAAMRSITSG